MSTGTAIIKPLKMQAIELKHQQEFAALDLRLVKKGLPDAVIAHHLGISVNTLREYRELLGYTKRASYDLVPLASGS